MAYTLGMIGAGNMAEAIIRSAIQSGVLTAQQIIVSDPSEEKKPVYESLGVCFTQDNQQVVREAKQVMLAVKPQVYPKIAGDLAAHLTSDHIVISIMAGLSSSKIAAPITEQTGEPVRVVRVMPNTPVMVNCGMAGVALGQDAHEGDDAFSLKLFSAGGNEAVSLTEPQIDALTAVSGSGPAYVFLLAEAMEKAACEMGLAEHAELLVSQTLLGASTLLKQSSDTAETLRRKVTSPNGTTQAAIETMQAAGVDVGVTQGVLAAQVRSKELGA